MYKCVLKVFYILSTAFLITFWQKYTVSINTNCLLTLGMWSNYILYYHIYLLTQHKENYKLKQT